MLEVPDARGRFFNEIVIVRDQEYRPWIFLYGDIQGVNGFEVEVIGGFVEHQNIRFLQHEFAERRRAASPRRARPFASIHLRAEQTSVRADRAVLRSRPADRIAAASRARSCRVEWMRDGPARNNRRPLRGPIRLNRVDGERFVLSLRRVDDQRSNHRGLSDAVAAHEGNLFAA